MNRIVFLSAVIAGAFVRAASAQSPALQTGLKRIFASNEFGPRQSFGPAVWIDNGAAYTTVERSAAVQGAADIVRYLTATGERSVFVSAKALIPTGQTAPIEIDDYALSNDGQRVLLFTNTARVWRQNTRGDYWVLDRPSGKLEKLGGDAPASTLMYAKFSPTGDRVGYVRQGDLYVESIPDQRITRLTTGADSLHVNGMSDWVYEEEFGVRDGFRWSPDGARLAFWSFDMTKVGTFRLINTTDSIYPFVIPIQYPKVGTPNSAVRAGVVSASGGPVTWIDLPGDPRDNYVPRMEWAGPSEVMVQRMNRLQNTNHLLLASATTGAAREVLVERDSAWVEAVDDIHWLAGEKDFTWVSERDGWRHVYRVSRDGRTMVPITNGAYDVVSVEGVDEKGGWLYFIASPDDAARRYLYRTRLDGKGGPVRLSPAGEVGTHGYDVSPDAQWAFHTFSNSATAPTVALVKLPSHDIVRTLVDDGARRTAIASLITKPREYFKVDVGSGLSVDGWMIKPRDFDSTRTYPVLVYVYGEPAGQTVIDSWSGSSGLWFQLLADQGYVVMSFDNQGTPAPRGRTWRKIVYGQIGVLSSAQQAEAVRAMTHAHRYLDPTRVGIWGWSGGGSSTLQAMFRYPDVYQVGMAVAPVADQLLYDTIYQERYMGLPSQHHEWFDKASPINFAQGLKGRLLVVHGSGDDNVHMQGTEDLVNKMVQAGKPFDLMVYPNRSHCICEGPGTTLHIYSLLSRYLTEHLPAGGRTTQTP